MAEGRPEIVLCMFRVRGGSEEALRKLCRDHDATLRRLDLVTGMPAVCYRGADDRERPFVVKIFEWKSAAALDAARRHPDVQIIWEAMEPLCEARDGRPSMEFPHVERIPL